MLKINKKSVLIFFVISSAIWSSSITIFNFPGIGSMYPLRIILLLYLVYLFGLCLKSKKNVPCIEKDDKFLFAFWVISLILTCINQKWETTLSYSISITTIILLISLIIRIVKSEKERLLAIKILIINCCILYLMALYETNNNEWIFHPTVPTKYNVNMMGTLTPVLFFGNTNNLCMFICMSLPCAFLAFNNKLVRFIYLFITLHISLITGCRTGLLVIVAFGFLSIFVKYITNQKLKFIVVYLLLTSCFFIVLLRDIQMDGRFYIWINAIYNSACSFFIGKGVGSAQFINSQNQLFSIHKSGYYGGYAIGAIHNYALELLLETGIIGITIIICWTKSIFKMIWKKRSEYKGFYYFCIVCFFLIATVCQSTMTQWFQAWVFWGILVSYSNDMAKEERNGHK